MANKNEVTISLEEYRELLLKEIPDNNDKWILSKIKEFITDNCELEDNEIKLKDSWDFGKKFVNYIKIIDKTFYRELITKIYNEEMLKQNNRLKMEKARKIKEIKEED